MIDIAKKYFAIIIVLIIYSISHGFCGNGEFTLGKEIDSLWLGGIKHMYRLEFDKAELEFKKINPDNPARELALAGLKWWCYSQNFDDPATDKKTFEEEFTKLTQQASDKCEKIIETEPKNASCYFIMGTAYGIMGRWHALENNWWSAYKYGNRGQKYLKQALKLNPGIYDAYAGIGIFDYYTDPDVVPALFKLPALILVRGSKKRGLEHLDIAINKGKFFPIETKLFLINILLRYEHNYDKAIKTAQEIQDTEPDNPFFCLIKILTFLKADRWRDTIDESKKFLEMYENTSRRGIQQQMSIIYLAAGDAYIMQNRFSLALNVLDKCINRTKYPGKAWVTLCHIRRGQIYDLLGERDKALSDYQSAYRRPNMWKSQKYAKKGLDKVYKLNDIVSQIKAE